MAKRNEQRANKEEASDVGLFNVGVMYPHDNVRWISALDKLTELILSGYADVDIELSEIMISVSEYAECRCMELMRAASDLTGMIRDLYDVSLSVDMNMINTKVSCMKLVRYTSFTDTDIIIETNRAALAFILLYVEQKEMLRQAKEADSHGSD